MNRNEKGKRRYSSDESDYSYSTSTSSSSSVSESSESEDKVYPFVGKIVTLPTKRNPGKFKAMSPSNNNKEYFLIYKDAKTKLKFQVRDSIRCNIIQVSKDTLEIVNTPIFEVGSDEGSFINIICSALSEGSFGPNKAIQFYKHLKGPDKNNPLDPFLVMSRYASIYEKSLGRKTEIVDKLLDGVTYTCNDQVTNILSRGQAELLLRYWPNVYDRRKLLYMGITEKEINDSSLTYHRMYEKLNKNPYSLPTLDEKRCEEIDKLIERVPNPLDRYCGRVLKAIHGVCKRKGWSCVTEEWLDNRYRFPDVIKEDRDDIRDHLIKEFGLVFKTVDIPIDCEDNKNNDNINNNKVKIIYEKDKYTIEKYVAKFIIDLVKGPKIHKMNKPVFVDDRLDSDQRSAITMAMKENVSLITGPAGSGKTTTERTLIKNLEMNDIPYIVTSFTGKAVIRAKELNGIGEKAATMHRIICGGVSDIEDFEYVIVDEATMTELELLYNFIRCFKHKYAIVFIGDINQLPPIGWGSPFNSFMKSRSVPRTFLTSIHRTHTEEGKTNGIITNTSKIAIWPDGEMFPFEKADNFIIMNKGEGEIMNGIKAFQKLKCKSKDVTVITPYKDQLDQLNRLCQLMWNMNAEKRIIKDKVWVKGEQKDREREFRVGDRVMLNKNNYEVMVFNGQEGEVIGFMDDNILVNFPTKIIQKKGTELVVIESEYILEMVAIEKKDLSDGDEETLIKKVVKIPFVAARGKRVVDKFDRDSVRFLDSSLLDISFALTVHKAQGSEWAYVIFFVPPGRTNIENTGFINRNLFYTALTRAGKMMILLDKNDYARRAIGNRLPYRCEFLTYRLMNKLERLYEYQEKVILTDGYAVDDNMPEDLFDDYDYYD